MAKQNDRTRMKGGHSEYSTDPRDFGRLVAATLAAGNTTGIGLSAEGAVEEYENICKELGLDPTPWKEPQDE